VENPNVRENKTVLTFDLDKQREDVDLDEQCEDVGDSITALLSCKIRCRIKQTNTNKRKTQHIITN